MKIITINMESKNTNEILGLEGDILYLNNIDEEVYNKLKQALPSHGYSYYKKEDNNLIISKLLFAIVSKIDNNLKDGCEIYIPGSETSVLVLGKEGMNLEYKPCMKNNN